MTVQSVIIELSAVADILGEMSHEIEQLGATLCGDMNIAVNHMVELQAIDVIAQKQRGLAALLRAECQSTALAALGLEELKFRLGTPFDRDLNQLHGE